MGNNSEGKLQQLFIANSIFNIAALTELGDAKSSIIGVSVSY